MIVCRYFAEVSPENPVTFDIIIAACAFVKIESALSFAFAYSFTASNTSFAEECKSFAISNEELPIFSNCELLTSIV